MLGRSHRAAAPKARITDVINHSKRLLGMPDGWRLAVVPGSDTGAVEMAMWSLLGPRPVDILSFETFSTTWANDVVKQLRLQDARVLEAPFGALPDLASVRAEADVVLAWNGTTSGARIANGEWIAADRAGLVICDATSAAFAMALPWDKLDVCDMGGEERGEMGGCEGEMCVSMCAGCVHFAD